MLHTQDHKEKAEVKIYTKTGDKGETGLVGGKRISKGSSRIEAYGNVDELNAVLGIVLSLLEPRDEDIRIILKKIQEELFVAGTDLATTVEHQANRNTQRIQPGHVQAIENLIDQFQEKLPALRNFILPSGTLRGSWLHFARTICRRAERSIVRLLNEEKIGEEILPYLNRLSDFLFVLARTVNLRSNAEEIQWKPQ